jgi:hypothetical protein
MISAPLSNFRSSWFSFIISTLCFLGVIAAIYGSVIIGYPKIMLLQEPFSK